MTEMATTKDLLEQWTLHRLNCEQCPKLMPLVCSLAKSILDPLIDSQIETRRQRLQVVEDAFFRQDIEFEITVLEIAKELTGVE